ncbi:hypothetical protein GQ53DRAFT_761588 [Thozetella sp. PMI_491]|nr:hypothetical protein GQ53DRAFT_761588 [Thozetella sp. PMI_491]
MFVTKALIPLAALASTVLADGASIGAALGNINNITNTLQATVAAWDGNLFGTLPITIQSAELLAAINDGTKVAKASDVLDINGVLTVASATISLASSVNTTITTLIAAKPKFDKLLLSPVILINLELEKKATDDFSAAIIEKIPTDFQAIAQSLVDGIDASFDQGIDKFNPFSGL